MSEPQKIPERRSEADGASASPSSPTMANFLIPSPIPCKRTRTYSNCERAMQQPTQLGVIKSFCRERGHGFVVPDSGGEPLFVHISDIEGDYIPKPGDQVSYKRIPVPPKNEKFSAVHVQIVHLAEGQKHETWDAPVHHD